MAIYKSDIADINLETGSILRSFRKHTIGTADQAADRIGVRAFRDGVPEDLSGASVYGYFRNSNGDNIALTSYGTVDGNVAYLTLPQACYNYEGNFTLTIKLLVTGVTSTVRIVDGIVDNTNTGSAVAPTSAVPSYSEILSQYDAMVAATAVANGAIATTFNAATFYLAGSYVINSGALYLLPEDHETNVTWANTSKVATTIGAEVSALKSAMNEFKQTFIDNETLLALTWARGSFDANGDETSSTIRIRTPAVSVSDIAYVHLVPAENYKIGYEKYKYDGTYLGEVTMSTDERYVAVDSNTSYIRFLAGKSNNGTITSSAGSNFTVYGVNKVINAISNLETYSNNISESTRNPLCVPVDKNLFEYGKYQRNSSSSGSFSDTMLSIRTKTQITLKQNDRLYLTSYATYSLTVVRWISGVCYSNTITSGEFYNDADCTAYITLTKSSAASLADYSLLVIERPCQIGLVTDRIKSWRIGKSIIGGSGVEKDSADSALSNFFYLHKNDIISIPVSSGFDCVAYTYSDSFVLTGSYSLNSSNAYRIVSSDTIARMVMTKHSGGTVTENEILTAAADFVFTNTSNQIQPKRKIIGVGHMGYYYAPQNSVIGVQMAGKAGWNAVEIDVHFTSDNVAVGIHNQSINDAARNDDGTEISETVNINEITYEDALEYDFGIVKGEQFAHTRISKIDDILKTAHQLGLLVMLDIKDTPVMTRTQIEAIVDLVNSNGMIEDTIFMVGQIIKYGQWIIRKDKNASVTGYGSQSNWATSYAYVSGYNTVYYDSLYSTIAEEYTAACVAAGFPQGAYTINNSTNMDALPNCISLYTSDYLNAEDYFANKNNQSVRLTTPGVRSSRATSIVGGYIRNGDSVRVDIQFTGNVDHSSTPGVFVDMPVPENGNAVLRCIKYTGTLSEPALVAEIPCMVNNTVILLKELENGGKYIITGEYSI